MNFFASLSAQGDAVRGILPKQKRLLCPSLPLTPIPSMPQGDRPRNQSASLSEDMLPLGLSSDNLGTEQSPTMWDNMSRCGPFWKLGWI